MFEHKLAAIICNRPFLPEFADENLLQRLIRRADGLFIWAATAHHYIKKGRPHTRNQVDVIVDRRMLAAAVTSPESKLEKIYTDVLRSVMTEQWTADETAQLCHLSNKALGTIAVLFLALSAPNLAAMLFPLVNDVLELMRDLHSTFAVLEGRCVPVRRRHASVRDFHFGSDKIGRRRTCGWRLILTLKAALNLVSSNIQFLDEYSVASSGQLPFSFYLTAEASSCREQSANITFVLFSTR